jgi:phospholipase C
MRGFATALVAFGVLLAGCAGKSGHVQTLPSLPGVGDTGSSKIKHIVFIVQENRTFDNLFGGPSPFPGADAASSGKAHDGSTIALDKVELECTDLTNCASDDPNNFHANFLLACNPPSGQGPPFHVGQQPAPCQMNGFDLNQTSQFAPGLVYSYVDYKETKPYWDIARAYAIGDRFFMSHNSESFVAHQYIFSGQSNNLVDEPAYPNPNQYSSAEVFLVPWGCDSPAGTTTPILDPQTGQETAGGPTPCFGYKSLADLAQAAGVSWRLYSYSICQNINALDVNQTIRYSSLWPSVDMSQCPSLLLTGNNGNFSQPETNVISDVQNGNLPSISWVLPGPITSDHPGVPAGYCGPSWAAQVVDAIGNSKYWDDTAIVIFWDDWGGFYDHVAPYVVRDQAGPGFRVPLLVVSKYAKRGYVSHSNGEFGTLLKFAEENFHLGSLGTTDASPYVGNLDDYFDWNNPKPFTHIDTQGYLLCDYKATAQRNRLESSSSRWLRMIDADD